MEVTLRASEFLDFLRRERLPAPDEQKFIFTHITIDDDLKSLRRKYRRQLTKHNDNKEE